VRGAIVALIEPEPGLVLPEEVSTTAFEFEPGVSIGRVPDWCRDPGVFETMLEPEHKRIVGSARHAFSAEFLYVESATHGNPQNLTPEEVRAERRIRNAILAMWLAHPFGFEVPFAVRASAREDARFRWDGGGRPDMDVQIGWRSDPDNSGNPVPGHALREARVLYEGMTSLPASGAVAVALEALWYSLTLRKPLLAFLVLWIALEALFGPSGPERVTACLKRWIPGFAEEMAGIGGLSKGTVDKWYRARCKIAHGRSLRPTDAKKAAELTETAKSVENVARRSLVAILKDPSLAVLLNGESRELELARRYGDPRPMNVRVLERIARLWPWSR
jgi:hypothetical protein